MLTVNLSSYANNSPCYDIVLVDASGEDHTRYCLGVKPASKPREVDRSIYARLYYSPFDHTGERFNQFARNWRFKVNPRHYMGYTPFVTGLLIRKDQSNKPSAKPTWIDRIASAV